MYSATRDSRGRTGNVRSGPGYVIDLIARDILSEEDRVSSSVTKFGIALSEKYQVRQHLCISREGNRFRGGIISGRFNHTSGDSGEFE